MSIRVEGKVYIYCSEDGSFIHMERGTLESQLLKKMAFGGTWPTSVAVYLLQYQPRFHQVEDVQSLVDKVVVLPFAISRVGSMMGAACVGPDAIEWHESGVAPSLTA